MNDDVISLFLDNGFYVKVTNPEMIKDENVLQRYANNNKELISSSKLYENAIVAEFSDIVIGMSSGLFITTITKESLVSSKFIVISDYDHIFHDKVKITTVKFSSHNESVVSQINQYLSNLTNKINIHISVPVADVYDKLTILDIKTEKINDTSKLASIQSEITALKKDTAHLTINIDFYNRLKYINSNLFNLLDQMYLIKHDVSNPEYPVLSNKSFIENDRRFRMKRKINMFHKSEIQEVKSYAAKCCIITNKDLVLDSKTIDNIQDMSTYYDKVFYIGTINNNLFDNDESIVRISDEEVEGIVISYKDLIKIEI